MDWGADVVAVRRGLGGGGLVMEMDGVHQLKATIELRFRDVIRYTVQFSPLFSLCFCDGLFVSFCMSVCVPMSVYLFVSV